MGFLSRLFGGSEDGGSEKRPARPLQGSTGGSPQSTDERALAQYRYMLRTAPPETIEQAHAEAFAKLNPEQRRMLFKQLTADLPDAERSASGVAAKDDPQSLARMATRAEVRQPGALERTFTGVGGRGMGMGGMMAGSFLSTIAGVVIGSAIAQSFLGDSGADGAADNTASNDVANESSADAAGSDGGDFDGGDFDGGDFS